MTITHCERLDYNVVRPLGSSRFPDPRGFEFFTRSVLRPRR